MTDLDGLLDADGEDSSQDGTSTPVHRRPKKRPRHYRQFLSPKKLKNWTRRAARRRLQQKPESIRTQLDDVLEALERESPHEDILQTPIRSPAAIHGSSDNGDGVGHNCANHEADMDDPDSVFSTEIESDHSGLPYDIATDSSQCPDQSVMSDIEAVEISVDEPSTCDMVFDDCPLSCYLSTVLVMSLINRHQLTQRAAQDVIALLVAHFPVRHRSFSSLYTLKSRFATLVGKQAKGTQTKYCTRCHSLLGSETHCAPCQLQDNKRPEVGEFLQLDIEYQIQQLFKDATFVSHLEDRFKCTADRVSDICTGQEYRKHVLPGGALRSKFDISLTMNTDGMSIIKSSSRGSLWPVFLSVNELPPKLRFSPRYLILAAAWCQRQKPSVYVYLMPIMKKLQMLFEQGIHVSSVPSGALCHPVLLLVATDLPARALVTCFKQFNGRNSCIYCCQEGTSVNGQICWPFHVDVCKRTKKSILKNARKATAENSPVNGVKSVSPLMLAKHFDLSKGVIIDYMHGVLLGVVRKLLDLWLQPSHRHKPYYIGNKIEALDYRLLTFQVPDTMSRRPRTLHEASSWKDTQSQSSVSNPVSACHVKES